MKKFWVLPLNIDTFISDTLGFTATETGAYIMLLIVAWKNGGGTVPDNDELLSRWTKISPNNWVKMKPRIMANWRLEEGIWHHSEIAERHSVATAKSASAKSAIESRWLKNKEKGDTDVSDPNYQLISSIYELEEKKKVSCPKPASPPSARKAQVYDLAFEGFWKAYPDRRNNSKPAAFKEWQKLAEEDQRLAVESLAAFSAYCRATPDYRVVHCERYLRDRRFDGWADEPARPVFFKV